MEWGSIGDWAGVAIASLALLGFIIVEKENLTPVIYNLLEDVVTPVTAIIALIIACLTTWACSSLVFLFYDNPSIGVKFFYFFLFFLFSGTAALPSFWEQHISLRNEKWLLTIFVLAPALSGVVLGGTVFVLILIFAKFIK